jgi:hypothetical protein
MLSAAATLLAATTAGGHGFAVYQNAYATPPTALGLLSEQPDLDNYYPPAGQGGPPNATPAPSNWNIFTDAFDSTPTVGNGGANYYGTVEGFVALESNPYNSNIGAYGIQSAMFNLLSPLYFADGNGSAAVPASNGTYLEFSVNPDPTYAGETPTAPLAGPSSESPPPAGESGLAVITGNSSFVPGFAVSGSIYHELLKELYIAGDSQTYGEYGYAFDVTYTLNVPPPYGGGTVTLTTPPMVDVFGLTDPDLGDYGDDAPYQQQDFATSQIFNAAMASAQAVPEPSTFLLGGIGFVAFAFVAWRRGSAARVLSRGRAR